MPMRTEKKSAAATNATQRAIRYLGTFISTKRTTILSPSFQPLQGFEGLGLVADLEVQALAVEGARVADQGDGLVRRDHVPDADQELRAVPVQGVIGHAVVDDEEVAVPLEIVGVDDLAVVDRLDDGLVLAGGDLDAVVHDDGGE